MPDLRFNTNLKLNTHRLKVLGFAAVAYLALGGLGLFFAVAPSYASPIFPAAGFAVAFLLWAGQRAWPAIWVGSLLLNLVIGSMHGDLGWRSAVLAAGIACSATLQATVARWLLQRGGQDGWRALEDERNIFRTLLLAGPLACLVASSTVLPQLYWAQSGSDANYLLIWWNWWSGDVLGVLMLLPLTLAVLFRKEPVWTSRWMLLLLPMLLSLSVVGGVMLMFTKSDQAEDKLVVARHGEKLAEMLDKRVTAHVEAVSALRRLLEVTPDMHISQFEHFTRITLKDNNDIFALSINPYVQASRRQEFERAMAKRSAISGFEIKERDSLRGLVRATERSDYFPVGLIAPLEGNRAAIGFDVNSNSVRREAIERARRTMASALTGPVQLVQENQKRVGVLLLDPAFEPASSAAASPLLIGFAVGVIKVDEMVQIATRSVTTPGLEFRLDDMQAAPEQSLLYSSLADPRLPMSDTLWQHKLRVADRSWRLSVYPTSQFEQERSHWTAVLVGSAGMALTALLQMLLLVTTGKTAVVQRKVLEQTAALRDASEALQDQNAQLSALFRLSPDGFVVLAADARVKFINPAFQRMTGIDSQTILGMEAGVLDAELRKRSKLPESFVGIDAAFQGPETALKAQMLELSVPSPRMLKMVGMHNASTSVARILYIRDVTHESEVERMKSEFLSTATHELRTPMASIFGFAEMLLTQDGLSPDTKEMLGIIHRQSHRMGQIINELLDLARIEARHGKDFVFTALPLQAFVENVIAEFKLPDGRTAPTLIVRGAPLTVMADRNKLYQAVLNVLSNAYKFSPDGGDVQIELINSPQVEAAQGNRVAIRVSDHGIGLTPEQLARLFERFYRADPSGHIPGTGLGMSMVQEIVKLHGGTVEVSSQYGVGTTVTLWLIEQKSSAAPETPDPIGS